jgi:hypothetical protein
MSLESGNEKRNCSHGQKKDSRSFLGVARVAGLIPDDFGVK